MKKLILSVATLLTIGASAVFANSFPEAHQKALENFKKTFTGAEAVNWSDEGTFSKATFVLGGSRAIALFNTEGELLGSVRDLLFNQLPLAVITKMEDRFGASSIFEIREITNNEGTHYQFIVEHSGKKLKVGVSSEGMINDIKKIKK